MKKLFGLLMIAGMMSFVACEPSAEEQAAEQARLDSLTADSIAQVEAAAAAEQTRINDSIAQVEAAEQTRINDSIANAPKGKKK